MLGCATFGTKHCVRTNVVIFIVVVVFVVIVLFLALSIYGAEPEAGDDALQSLRAGKVRSHFVHCTRASLSLSLIVLLAQIVKIDVPKTICDGQQTQVRCRCFAAARCCLRRDKQAIGVLPFEIIKANVKDILTVPDAAGDDAASLLSASFN